MTYQKRFSDEKVMRFKDGVVLAKVMIKEFVEAPINSDKGSTLRFPTKYTASTLGNGAHDYVGNSPREAIENMMLAFDMEPDLLVDQGDKND